MPNRTQEQATINKVTKPYFSPFKRKNSEESNAIARDLSKDTNTYHTLVKDKDGDWIISSCFDPKFN